MTEQNTSNILFIINPKAGKSQKDYQLLIQNQLKELQSSLHFYTLQGKDDNHLIERAIARLKPKTIVAVGGDGTVSLVAKKIVETNINLAIIPAGSANGMAKELNIPEDTIEALHIILNGISKKADVIQVNNILCIHLSDIGLNARLIKYFERGNMRGKLGYALLAIKVFFRKQNIRATIRLNGKEIERKTLMVVIANASKYGTGAIINPTGNINDRLFEVVVVKEMGLFTLLKLWFNPRGLTKDKIEIFQTNEAYITFNKKYHFQVDGEYIGKVKTISAYIQPSQINIIVPKEI